MVDKAAFLKELTELSYKYGIEIVGCGCCGSPWLNTYDELKPGQRYTVDEGGDRLKFNVFEGDEPVRKGEWT